MSMLMKAVVSTLREYADKIESGNSNLTANECLELVAQCAHINLTKQEVASRYKVSQKTIERHEKDGTFPQSHPAPATKKHWYLDELLAFEQDNHIDIY